MNPFPMVLADLRAMRVGALMTIILIGLAVMIGIGVGAQERALRQSSARTAGDFPLLIGAPGSQTQLVLTTIYLQAEALPLIDGAILRKLTQDTRVAAIAPLAYGDIVKGYPIVGTTLDFVTRWGRLAPIEGRLFERENEAVVGAMVDLHIGDIVAPSHGVVSSGRRAGIAGDEEAGHRHQEAKLSVVGRLPRLDSPWDRAILVPVESVWEVHGLGNGHEGRADHLGPPFDMTSLPGAPALVVKPKTIADAYQLRAEFRQGGTMALFPAEVLTSLYASLGDIRDLLVIASAMNNVVVLLAILLLLVTLTSLRRKRYAVLRALGATRIYVAVVVWLGATILTTAGCLLGVGLGWLAAQVLSHVIEAQTGLVLHPALGPQEAMLAFAMGAIAAVFALVVAAATMGNSGSNALRS